MAYEIIKKLYQNQFLSKRERGVCYHMCSYLESDLGIWNQPNTFENAVSRARSFAQGTEMVHFAKARRVHMFKLPDYTQQLYASQEFSPNTLYRIQVCQHLRTAAGLPVIDDRANHEVIIITGELKDIICFDPNHGFILIARSENPSCTNFRNEYRAISATIGMQISFFIIKEIRKITEAYPKGFMI